ncbi:uncharacterized protein L201_002925 [Kwoniella dendrophila CBS 6074]|uniref:Uncharacterized protein n=1 Tax=Kwoniella dendrophila CBS 6074 TaxID=1295534 RepID=A0AAX4JRJ1_9TREE
MPADLSPSLTRPGPKLKDLCWRSENKKRKLDLSSSGSNEANSTISSDVSGTVVSTTEEMKSKLERMQKQQNGLKEDNQRLLKEPPELRESEKSLSSENEDLKKTLSTLSDTVR